MLVFADGYVVMLGVLVVGSIGLSDGVVLIVVSTLSQRCNFVAFRSASDGLYVAPSGVLFILFPVFSLLCP